MRPDVRRMPVIFMGNKNHAWLMLRQNFGDRPDRRRPICPVLLPRFQIDALQTVTARHLQIKTKHGTGVLQFPQTGSLSPAFAAQCHGDVGNIPFCLAQKPQRQPANNALIIRVW